jgi:hypothetical protein
MVIITTSNNILLQYMTKLYSIYAKCLKILSISFNIVTTLYYIPHKLTKLKQIFYFSHYFDSDSDFKSENQIYSFE